MTPKIMATMPYDLTVDALKISGQGGSGDISGGYTSIYNAVPEFNEQVGAFLTNLTVDTMLAYLHTPFMLTIDDEQYVLTPVHEGLWAHLVGENFDVALVFEQGHYWIGFVGGDPTSYIGKTMDLSYANTGGIIPAGRLTITENGTNYNVYEYAELDVNVPSVQPQGTKSITANGTYNVTPYEFANVNVSGSADLRGTLTITNSSYSMQAQYINASGQMTKISMSANGTYTVPVGWRDNDGIIEAWGFIYLNRSAGITITGSTGVTAILDSAGYIIKILATNSTPTLTITKST